MKIYVADIILFGIATAVEKNNVQEIRKLMSRKEIHSIPIIQYSKQLPNSKVTIQGIVTTSDIGKDVDEKTLAAEVMTPNVHVIHKDSSARSAAKMMLKHKVHHLVVMDNGKIIGMISSLDFVNLVADHTLD